MMQLHQRCHGHLHLIHFRFKFIKQDASMNNRAQKYRKEYLSGKPKGLLSERKLPRASSTNIGSQYQQYAVSAQLSQDWRRSTFDVSQENPQRSSTSRTTPRRDTSDENAPTIYSDYSPHWASNTPHYDQQTAHLYPIHYEPERFGLEGSYHQNASYHLNPSSISCNTKESNTMDQYGLIILGNSGVGKSFLANILLGCEAFTHEVRSDSVTRSTDFMEVSIGQVIFAIFDIPGLIEADPKRIAANKKEIDKAFLQRPNSIIMYVFGNQNGRLREEDVVAFKAINAAYSFRREALVIVVNDVPKRRARDYEGTTLVLLKQLLPNVEMHSGNVCFLDCIEPDNHMQKQVLKEQLLKAS